MTQTVTGTVEGINSKKQEGQYGSFYRTGLLIGGEWFNLNSQNPAQVNKGDNVRIQYTTDSNGRHNIAKNGLSIVSNEKQQQTAFVAKPPLPPKTFVDNTIGMIKGNTVSNAVLLATARAGKQTSLDDLKQAATDVLELHKHLEALDIKTLLAKQAQAKARPLKARLEQAAAAEDPFTE